MRRRSGEERGGRMLPTSRAQGRRGLVSSDNKRVSEIPLGTPSSPGAWLLSWPLGFPSLITHPPVTLWLLLWHPSLLLPWHGLCHSEHPAPAAAAPTSPNPGRPKAEASLIRPVQILLKVQHQ